MSPIFLKKEKKKFNIPFSPSALGRGGLPALLCVDLCALNVPFMEITMAHSSRRIVAEEKEIRNKHRICGEQNGM